MFRILQNFIIRGGYENFQPDTTFNVPPGIRLTSVEPFVDDIINVSRIEHIQKRLLRYLQFRAEILLSVYNERSCKFNFLLNLCRETADLIFSNEHYS